MNYTLTLKCECGQFLIPTYRKQIKYSVIRCNNCSKIFPMNELYISNNNIFHCVNNVHSHALYICELCAVSSMVYNASNSSSKCVISTLTQLGYGETKRNEALKISDGNLGKALEYLNKIDKNLNVEKKELIQNQYLNDLVDGYLKNICISKYILTSIDITHLIIGFYGNISMGIIAYLKHDYFICKSQYEKTDRRTPNKLQFFNINSETFEFGHLYYTSHLHEWRCNDNKHKSNMKQNIITTCKLPKYFQNVIKRQYHIEYCKQLFNSTKWNIIFDWNRYSYITLLNNEYLNHTYTFRFPEFPQKQSAFHCMAKQSSFAYSKINNTLYNMRLSEIHSLNFDNEDLNWRLITKENNNNEIDEIISSCMVDNDRFIFNAHNGLNNSLFALNSNLTIRLPERINNITQTPHSIYHNKFHKIIFSEYYAMEWYDMNKDRWINLLTNAKIGGKWENICNVYYTKVNPNIIYGIRNNDTSLCLMGIDVRNKNNQLITDISIAKPKNAYGVYLPLF